MRWPWQRKKKKTSEPEQIAEVAVDERSYLERVDAFWSWWSANSNRILDSVDNDGGASIQPEISEQVNTLYQGIGWVFGPPGSDQARHSFTITPEGCELDRYFVNCWHAKQPDLPEWTFYQSRQPAEDQSEPFSISIDGVNVSSESLWITPSVDSERQEIDITAWSPTFDEISEKSAWTFLFLLLDEALGEENTSRCLGSIDISSEKLAGAMPASELVEFVETTFAENEWNRDAICKVYQANEYQGDFPRGDTFIGSTEAFELVKRYDQGPFEHASAHSGGEFAFIQIPVSVLPEDDPVLFRGDIEDKIDERLAPQGLGKTLGGAMGHNAFYIDFVSFDKKQVRKIISDLLTEQDCPFQIFPFVK